jgi:hypothetical protein
VALIYVTLGLLASYVFLTERTEPAAEQTNPALAGSSLLETDAASVTALTLRKEGRVILAARENGRWRAVEPPGAQVSPDLFEATIATLTAGQASEKLAAETESGLAAYGLDVPSASLEVGLAAKPGAPVIILIGARNPTRTAVYARRTDQASIFLVGMNLSYYVDLIFDAAKP